MPRKRPEPREYTEEEVRALFLDQVRVYTRDTIRQANDGEITWERAVWLAVFSTLVCIDGEAAMLPSFALIPCPHMDDKEYNRKHGDNWYPVPEAGSMAFACDISGPLHEELGGE